MKFLLRIKLHPDAPLEDPKYVQLRNFLFEHHWRPAGRVPELTGFLEFPQGTPQWTIEEIRSALESLLHLGDIIILSDATEIHQAPGLDQHTAALLNSVKKRECSDNDT
ncbi:MAG: hypothetical protein WDN28_18880 [Chthoniobacter sp.]